MSEPAPPEIDWRSVLVRYIKAVLEDDICIGERCLIDRPWRPEWSPAEAEALRAVRLEAWPEGYEWREKP